MRVVDPAFAHAAASEFKFYIKQRSAYNRRTNPVKSGWAAYRWKRDLLERMSIAIAKGNWALLDAHTPVRPFGAAA